VPSSKDVEGVPTRNSVVVLSLENRRTLEADILLRCSWENAATLLVFENGRKRDGFGECSRAVLVVVVKDEADLARSNTNAIANIIASIRGRGWGNST